MLLLCQYGMIRPISDALYPSCLPRKHLDPLATRLRGLYPRIGELLEDVNTSRLQPSWWKWLCLSFHHHLANLGSFDSYVRVRFRTDDRLLLTTSAETGKETWEIFISLGAIGFRATLSSAWWGVSNSGNDI